MKPRALVLVTVLTSGLLALGEIAPVHSAWIVDGNPIAASDSTEFDPIIASDQSGGAFVAWRSLANNSTYYYITRVTAAGDLAPGWGPQGLKISGAALEGQIIADGAGGALAAWIENLRSYELAHIVMKRVTPAGALAPGWGSSGLDRPGVTERDHGGGTDPESPHAHGGTSPALLTDGAGGFLVAWVYNDRFLDLAHVTHYSGDGSVLGTDPFSNAIYGYRPRICSDVRSGTYVSWEGGIRLHHLVGSGALDPRWPAAGITLAPYALNPTSAGLCPDGEGGVFVSWLEQTGGPGLQPVIQHITDSSAVAPGWPAGGILLSPNACQAGGLIDGREPQFDHWFMSIVSDGAGGALVAWQDTRDDAGDIYVQRILGDGNRAPGWPLNGLAARKAPGSQAHPVLVADGNGGALIAWQDGRRASDVDIYAHHVLTDGTLLPGVDPSGFPVCTAPGHQERPQIVEDGTGGAIIAWTDRRSGNRDIYATRLGADGPVSVLVAFVRADALPGLVRLEWASALPPGTPAELSRRDGVSSEWEVMAQLEADGSGRFIYGDRAVAPGKRYGYRLGVSVGGGMDYSSVVEVLVPHTLELALENPRPNPVESDLSVDFTLPDGAVAGIDVLDIQGRVLARREVGALGPGRHKVRITRRGELPGGIYWIRLSRRGEARTARVAILK